ncbi:uncharacterized protein LOC127934660 isoform X3 [Carassius gibelio]|uniref:uncharacterized protein LOC127934660 isoform X3 n=1 Tax=Carassius gibelio TaxID=101364 RepID=UPI002277ABDA|nr:uncharacterized protein LOC127934660 isoform X3 [Carassius gibelio]
MEKSSSEESAIHRSPSVDSRDSDFAQASTSGRPFGGRGFNAGAFYGSTGPRAQTSAPSGAASDDKANNKYKSPKGSKYVVFYLDLSFVFLLEFKKCNMARGCLCCLKYMMFVFNLIFWIRSEDIGVYGSSQHQPVTDLGAQQKALNAVRAARESAGVPNTLREIVFTLSILSDLWHFLSTSSVYFPLQKYRLNIPNCTYDEMLFFLQFLEQCQVIICECNYRHPFYTSSLCYKMSPNIGWGAMWETR